MGHLWNDNEGGKKESTWSKTFRVLLCTTLNPHGLAWDETQVYVLRSS